MAKDTLIKKLNRLLADHLDDFASGLIPGESNDRVLGFIVSAKFVGHDHADRQTMLLDLLRQFVNDGRLSEREHERIGPIVTMTPDEATLKDDAA